MLLRLKDGPLFVPIGMPYVYGEGDDSIPVGQATLRMSLERTAKDHGLAIMAGRPSYRNSGELLVASATGKPKRTRDGVQYHLSDMGQAFVDFLVEHDLGSIDAKPAPPAPTAVE